MVKKTDRPLFGLRNYGKAFGIFIAFVILSLCVFFFAVGAKVEENAKKTLTNNIFRQSFHFYNMFDMQYNYLEGIAGGLAESEDLFGEDNLMALKEFSSHSTLQRAAIIDLEGNIYYDNGEKNNVSERDYFQIAVQGKRALSLPLTSRVDQKTRVILAVPIWKNEDEVGGVLGVSCDLSALNHMLFRDIYGGTGCSMLVSQEGTIVTYDDTALDHRISAKDNFFDYYGKKKFADGGSIDQVRKDFQSQTAGSAKMHEESDSSNPYYLVYAPLRLNHWMVCYLVPVSAVGEEYLFIPYYEILLSGVLFVAFLILLLSIFWMNRKNQAAILHFAKTDALTNIDNRFSTEASINSYLETGEKSLSAFMIMDVDNFKTINDTYGHASGDIVLQKIGQLLQTGFRGSDVVGRIGGDEFIIFMKRVESKAIVFDRIRELQKNISGFCLEEVEGHKITTSMGVSFSPEHGTTYSQLYKAADKALYETKRQGRDGYTVFSPQEEEQSFGSTEEIS